MDIDIVQEGKKQFIIIKAEIDTKPTASGSGKSLMLATTSGNMKTGKTFNNQEIVIGMNVYIKNDKYKPEAK